MEAFEYRRGRLSVELLKRNGSGQRLERWLSNGESARPYTPDNLGHYWIGLLEVEHCGFHRELALRR
jgi:hypothetical protein